MATLFLIRHAEPERTGVMLGQLDPALSAAGVQQAATLAKLTVSIVWSSPLRRARQTAGLIGAPVIELPELRELDQGEWTGKSWPEIEAQWPELAARKLENWIGIPAPEGEPWEIFVARIRTAWNRIRSGPEPAAIVAHQAVNAALLHLIEGRDPVAHSQELRRNH